MRRNFNSLRMLSRLRLLPLKTLPVIKKNLARVQWMRLSEENFLLPCPLRLPRTALETHPSQSQAVGVLEVCEGFHLGSLKCLSGLSSTRVDTQDVANAVTGTITQPHILHSTKTKERYFCDDKEWYILLAMQNNYCKYYGLRFSWPQQITKKKYS